MKKKYKLMFFLLILIIVLISTFELFLYYSFKANCVLDLGYFKFQGKTDFTIQIDESLVSNAIYFSNDDVIYNEQLVDNIKSEIPNSLLSFKLPFGYHKIEIKSHKLNQTLIIKTYVFFIQQIEIYVNENGTLTYKKHFINFLIA